MENTTIGIVCYAIVAFYTLGPAYLLQRKRNSLGPAYLLQRKRNSLGQICHPEAIAAVEAVASSVLWPLFWRMRIAELTGK